MSYYSSDFRTVKMRNEGESKIIGIGDIVLILSLGYMLMLKNIRHVPNICFNLLPIGVLDDEGYYNVFGENKWKLTKKSLVAARGIKKRSFYFMQAKLGKREVSAMEEPSISKLWHR